MSIYNSDATSSSFSILGNAQSSVPAQSNKSGKGGGRSSRSAKSAKSVAFSSQVDISEAPNVVGMSRLDAINELLAYGFDYSLSYTTLNASLSNNDTVSSQSTMDMVVTITVYKLLAPTVTGGTLASDSTYYYRAFTSSDSLVISNGTISADILVVSGGGNAGNAVSGYGPPAQGGGGGAGGILYSTSQSLSSGTYTTTIGAGGGNASSFSKDSYVLSPNGGGAGGGIDEAGGNGGSGGGGGGNGAAGGVHTGTGIGYEGGAGFRNFSYFGGGGGGGAGGAGQSGIYSASTNHGGVGVSTFDSLLAPFNLGEISGGERWIGGGGAGFNRSQNYGWAGGLGGGGDNNGGNGDANTGGGGSAAGGLGGSGIVIVRYLKSAVA